MGNLSNSEFTKASLLAKNTLWNSLGLVLPLFVGLLSMPFLINGLGIERFGVLTIIWMVIGYFSIFDFGLGRALTKLIAERLGRDKKDQESIPSLFWTAMSMMLFLSVIGSLIVCLIAERMVFVWLNIDQYLQSESLSSFYLMSLSIPIVVATTGFRGMLEAYQKFKIINSIRIPLGLLTFLGPLVVIPFSNSLSVIIVVLFFGRLLGLYAYYYYCIRTVPSIKENKVFDKKQIGPLLNFGGWLTLSNIIGPLMVYLDRFLIGSVLTMTAVAYYVTPYEMITKLWMIPMGLIGVLFPALSTLINSDRDKAVYFFSKGVIIIFHLMFPVFLIINLYAFEGITIWLGHEFAENSTTVMQWLSIGVFLNCVARMPMIMIQSAGRPDLITKLFLFESPLYIAALWYALDVLGINGAAMVWTARVLVDTVAMFILSSKAVRGTGKLSMIFIGKLAIAISILFGVTFAEGIILKSILLFILILLNVLLAWNFGFSSKERASLSNIFLKEFRRIN